MARPEHQPTAEQRTTVAIAAGGGMSHEEIAIGLGIDAGTLLKHYAQELSEGAYLRRAEVLQALHAAAMKGNASAAREYLSSTPQVAAPPSPAASQEPAEKTRKLGKKEQAALDAKTAGQGSDWGELLPGPARLN